VMTTEKPTDLKSVKVGTSQK
jgi:hypothetical protein